MKIAVVGAGITGLVAAYRLRLALGPDAEIVVADAGDRVGGKLHSARLTSGMVDVGAEAFVSRRPEVPALLSELGLADQLVRPSGARPLIRSGGALHPLPVGTLMGIPATADSVRGLVDDATYRQIATEATRPLHWTRGDDLSVGELVSARFGSQVVARSVDPLLGGVYSGLASSIGVRAAVPPLAAALDAGAASLTHAVTAALPLPVPGPVFGGIRDGYGVLLRALVEAAGATVLTGTSVGVIERASTGWTVNPIGPVDGVVVCTPAPEAARVIGSVVPAAASELAQIRLASSVLVALAFDDVELPNNSGVLVATGEPGDDGKPLRAKAFTLSSRKWPHLADRGVPLVRCSFGRFGDDAIVEMADADLVATAREDLGTVLGVTAAPTDTVVQRWRGGLPQYAPGHTERVRAIVEAVDASPGIEVAGAYLHGVGVPACIASGTRAAQRLAEALAEQ
ncbi:protoporphyrinogen oxidase [Rhodococcoides trifolii]|uniref:Protoporphyrinogen oxidase n=1 Tax=Rhodococcoides trifolii TaxID=908250 RepID=A0A917D352_9NOCA|nr:protoporphyrinogen oxidase [Rhodococcus trifolii]GGG08633.1 protoporphyrinogen oxidase [Rhodococcus trifolii]